MNRKVIAERLVTLRGKRSQREVAEAIGVCQSTYAMYETGQRMPSDEKKWHLRHILNVLCNRFFLNNKITNSEKGKIMNDLVIEKNHEAVCTSLQIAEKFGKQHGHVIRDIEKLLGGISKNGETYFRKSSYINEQNGQRYPMYYMTRDGFSLLAMGFTGKKALEWKLKYINAFNQMEAIISEQRTPMFIEERTQNKVMRLAETDIIKDFVDYARNQGSNNAEKYYSNYTRLANKAVGIESVKYATTIQLNRLTLIENIIINQIRIGMEQKKYYKEIFKDCKKQIETFKAVAYLG